jgi:hypothetical protein
MITTIARNSQVPERKRFQPLALNHQKKPQRGRASTHLRIFSVARRSLPAKSLGLRREPTGSCRLWERDGLREMTSSLLGTHTTLLFSSLSRTRAFVHGD